MMEYYQLIRKNELWTHAISYTHFKKLCYVKEARHKRPQTYDFIYIKCPDRKFIKIDQ